jgi:hypothetical protein
MPIQIERTYEQVWSDILAAHPAESLKGYWKMDDASGGLVDSSGNSHAMAENGNPTYAQTPMRRGSGAGDSIAFDGTGDYFNVADHAHFTPGSAFTALASFSTTSVGTRIIVSQYQATGNQRSWRLLTSGGNLFIGTSTDGIALVAKDTGVAVNDGLNHHAALVYNGTDALVYLDGLLVATSTNAGGLHDSSADLVIGAQDGGGSAYLGDISEVSILNVILTPQQIAELHSAAGRYISDLYDDTIAKLDAAHGAPYFNHSNNDPTATVADSGQAISYTNSPTQDNFSPVGTKGELAITHNGVDQRSDFGTLDFDSGAFWLSAWVKGDGTQFPIVFDHEDNGVDKEGFKVYFSTTRANWGYYYASGTWTVLQSAVGTIHDNEWNLIQIWWAGGTADRYIKVNDNAPTAGVLAKYYRPHSNTPPNAMQCFEHSSSDYDPCKVGPIRIYQRIPVDSNSGGGEADAHYWAGRSFVVNWHSTAAQNADYTTRGSALTVVDSPTTVDADNLTYWVVADTSEFTVAPGFTFLPATANETWMTNARCLTYGPATPLWVNGGGLPATGRGSFLDLQAQQDAASALHLISAVDYARFVNMNLSAGAVGHSGQIFEIDAAANKIEGCFVIHQGDQATVTNELELFAVTTGNTATLRNSVVWMDNDDIGGTPKVAGGLGTMNYEHVTAYQNGAETAVDMTGDGNKNSVVFDGTTASVWQNTTEVTGQVVGDIFVDAANYDFTVLDESTADQTGTLLFDSEADAFGTAWSVLTTPNAGHFNTVLVTAEIADRTRYVECRRPNALVGRMS